jgi:ribosomal protein S12 methylthiotransferase accessory factor
VVPGLRRVALDEGMMRDDRLALTPQVERLLDLVSPLTGVVSRLDRLIRGADEPTPPILYAARISNYDFKRVPDLERGAAGKGLTENAAIGGAIGEAVERYCASHVDTARLRRTSLADAPAGALLPAELVLYSARQYGLPGFPFLAPTDQLEIDWLIATEWFEGPGQQAEAWVPAVAVYLHGNNVMPGDALFLGNSSGLAAGSDLDAALRSGLCELIERDAFVVTWLNKLSPARIVVDGGAAALAGIIDHYRRFDVDLQLYALDTDTGIPVVMALALSDKPEEPAAVVGLGCHLDAGEAALRAAFEVCQVRPSQVHHRRTPRRLAATDVRGIEDHSAYFAQHEVLHELDFICSSTRTVALAALPRLSGPSTAADRQTCVRALRRIGCRVFGIDLTTPDLLPYPIRVVRTLASGLQPIHFGNGMARLGGSRLQQAARRWRAGIEPPCEDELNACPHPLA